LSRRVGDVELEEIEILWFSEGDIVMTDKWRVVFLLIAGSMLYHSGYVNQGPAYFGLLFPLVLIFQG
jgi:hypothetical protein